MINTISAMFSKQKPKLTITGIYKLSNDEYIVEAVEDVNVENYNDPFYKVNIINGAITNYLPMSELDRFVEAVEKRTIYKK